MNEWEGQSFPWARAVFVVPFLAMLVVALVFACKPPSSGDGDGPGPAAQGTVIPTLGTPRPTAAPVVIPTAPAPTQSQVPGDAESAMDDYEEAPPPPEPSVTAAPPVPTAVDFRDPVAVSHAAVVTLWTVDTTKDAGPIAGDKRAAPYLSQALNNEVQMAPTTGKLPSDWYELASHQGKTVVVAVPADEAGKPADTPTEAWHAWAVTVSPIGADGWLGVPQEFTVFVALSRTMVDQPWLVTDYESS